METLRYLLFKGRLFIYAFLAIAFSGALSFVLEKNVFAPLFLLIFVQLFINRLTDDFFDREKDEKKGKKVFPKETIQALLCLFCIFYVVVNLYLYSFFGALSLMLILLAFIQEKLETLQMFSGDISALYYLCAYRKPGEFGIREAVFLLVLLLASVLFGIMKRRKSL
jgi:hypothetical protein